MEMIPDVECWDKETRKRIKELCKKWGKDNLTVQEIKDTISTFDWAVSSLLPKLENGIYASNSLDILIDDILEMDSISDEEKDQAIMELYEIDKEELTDLAKKAIKQIEINHQEFLEEAEKRGYCPILTKEQ